MANGHEPIPAVNSHIRWVELSDATVIMYNMHTADYLDLKAPLTVQVWLAIDGRRGTEEIAEHVNCRNNGDLPKLTASAVRRVLDGLVRMDLVAVNGPAPRMTDP